MQHSTHNLAERFVRAPRCQSAEQICHIMADWIAVGVAKRHELETSHLGTASALGSDGCTATIGGIADSRGCAFELMIALAGHARHGSHKFLLQLPLGGDVRSLSRTPHSEGRRLVCTSLSV